MVSTEKKVDELLEKNRDRLEALAQSLLQRETLTSREIDEVLENAGPA